MKWMQALRRRQLKIGLALGGGGARGYAHIPILETLDALQLRPHAIAGTSIGAVFGAIYAAGLSGAQIRAMVMRATIAKGDGIRDILKKKELLKWIDLAVPEFGRAGLVRSDRIVRRLLEEVQAFTFADLNIPLVVVATDLWSAETVVFRSGELLPAVRASMAVPGVFAPVTHEGRALVDGGLMNLVPYDLLAKSCDLIIAVNVSRAPRVKPDKSPGMAEVLRRTIDIMQSSSFRVRLQHKPPDILVEPNIGDARISDFGRAEEILLLAQPAADRLRQQLEKLI